MSCMMNSVELEHLALDLEHSSGVAVEAFQASVVSAFEDSLGSSVVESPLVALEHYSLAEAVHSLEGLASVALDRPAAAHEGAKRAS